MSLKFKYCWIYYFSWAAIQFQIQKIIKRGACRHTFMQKCISAFHIPCLQLYYFFAFESLLCRSVVNAVCAAYTAKHISFQMTWWKSWLVSSEMFTTLTIRNKFVLIYCSGRSLFNKTAYSYKYICLVFEGNNFIARIKVRSNKCVHN